MATILIIFPQMVTERHYQVVERQLKVVERQFQVVERQTQVAERRSGPFRLNLTTAATRIYQASPNNLTMQNSHFSNSIV